ncbi:hypothetical protein [Siphonobacter aquaeclarae]|uniref:Uncharacterized protein n=1 Tax=Siphonobacter aquaeclarae TaxID=563176 RepID=A0A1G9X696_9BACT|nr:hypothetical protein [Siphonobacter aquaeclarae]SDM92026.1 hypothetical protein SAMN04488090_4564 [Siphonobacter aquaeclarae]
MKKSICILAFLFATLWTSCQKKSDELRTDNSISVIGGRLRFANEKLFRMTLMDLSDAKRSKITKSLLPENFESIGKQVEVAGRDTLPFPACYYPVLNSNMEYQVADTIFRYDLTKRVKYAIPSSDMSEFENNEIGRDKYVVAQFSSNVLQMPASKSGRSYLTNIEIDARHQKEFYLEQYNGLPAQGRRKYVHELVTYQEIMLVGNRVVVAYLDLRIKLESKARTGWDPTNEARHISYSLTGETKVLTSSSPSTWYPQNNQNNININDVIVSFSDLKIPLQQFSYAMVGSQAGHYFSVELNGFISQQVNGDVPQNAWINSGYPLW